MSSTVDEYLFLLGSRLSEERTRLGYSQKNLADLMAKTSRTQIKYEAGETAPDGAYLAKLLKLGGDVLYVLTGKHSAEALTADEEALLNGYRQLDSRGKAGMLGMLHGLTAPETGRAVFHGEVGQVVEGNQTNHAPLTFNVGGKKRPKKSE